MGNKMTVWSAIDKVLELCIENVKLYILSENKALEIQKYVDEYPNE